MRGRREAPIPTELAHAARSDVAPAIARLFAAAVDGARPARLLAAVDWDQVTPRPLAAYQQVAVVGAGKAALAMAGELEHVLAARRAAHAGGWHGAVTVPHGYATRLPDGVRPPTHLSVRAAAHPIPDTAGLAAAEEALAIAAACGEGDLVLVLLSGGASALWPAFAGGVTLDDARRTGALLLASGADITAVNAVRKHLTRVGGGQLAAAAAPADVVGLAISDVVGDDPSTIGSGPTVPDPTTYADAARVLRAHTVDEGVARGRPLWDVVPDTVRRHLARGLAGLAPETPKPGAHALARATTRVVGGVGDALAAARAEAERVGWATRVVSAALTGEARDAGVRVAHAVAAAADDVAASGRPVCLLWGGETTVTVRGPGRGGRNQELALAAALALDEWRRHDEGRAARVELAVLSAGTDGVDGPTDAAGAWATLNAVSHAAARGLDARAVLAANDSHPFFAALDGSGTGGLLRPGPTHTNVMDVQIAVARRRDTG